MNKTLKSDDTCAPEGFGLLSVASPFVNTNGPLWICRTGGRMRVGFRVEARHTNIARTCHGGMIATLCDMLLTLTARAHSDTLADSFMSTIGLQVDYIAPAALDAWVEGEAQVLCVTGRMLFMQALVRADETLIARTSAILKVGKALHDSGLNGESAKLAVGSNSKAASKASLKYRSSMA
jgi:uncharacterized protein (TIGR00369 family)